MNIGMIAYTDYAHDPRVRREAEALVARGDSVDFLCLKDKKGTRIAHLSGVRLVFLNVGKYRGDNVGKYILSYLWFLLNATVRMAIEHARHPYQIIHVHTMPDFLVFSAIIPKMFGAKVVLDVHDLTPELYATKFGIGRCGLLVRLFTFVERRSVSFAHRAIAVHKPHLSALVSHGNPAKKFFVLLNTPDQRWFNKCEQSSPRADGLFRLVYHGTISRRHGLDVGLEAVASLRTRIPSLSFDVVGDGDDLGRITRRARELCLTDIVHFSGRLLPLEELGAAIRGADVGVIPILNDEFTRYMLPTKLMEYALLGIPTITSRTTTIESYFDDTMVRYVKPGSAESLAEAIWDLYQCPAKRRAIASNAERFNSNFCWEKQRKLFYEFVDDVAGTQVARGKMGSPCARINN